MAQCVVHALTSQKNIEKNSMGPKHRCPVVPDGVENAIQSSSMAKRGHLANDTTAYQPGYKKFYSTEKNPIPVQ